MDRDYPEALQVEVTNRCNLNCYMCIRHFWDAKPGDLSLNLYERILESASQHLRKIILYGFGEPFINPDFIEMLRVARRVLPKDSEIIVSTNGLMLNQNLSERILRLGVNNISISIDTIDALKLRRIREGCELKILLENIHCLVRVKKICGVDSKIGVTAVLMKDNFMDLPHLIERMAEEEIDYISISNVIPYAKNVFHEAVYVTVSKKPLEIVRPILGYGRRFILDAIYEAFSNVYGVRLASNLSETINNFWKAAEDAGYWLNIPLILELMGRISIAEEVEKVLEICRKISYEHGIPLSIPKLYPDARDRRCPYVDGRVAFIRSDGAVAPCQEFAYKHPVYINMHIKIIHPIIFGDSRNESILDIWNRKEYAAFREIRRSFPENIPWCGDCIYSMFRCFFSETNHIDCFGNKPSCSECLYSAGISQCNI